MFLAIIVEEKGGAFESGLKVDEDLNFVKILKSENCENQSF